MTQKSGESGLPEYETNKMCDTFMQSVKVKEKKERIHPCTKVVIRRLPPTMTKEEFLSLISPVPEHDFFYFVPADMTLGPYAFSRAYINFSKQEDIFTFKEKFDNYIFLDKRGREYPAVVEFAPFQRIPEKREPQKKNPKVKTLQEHPSYIMFLESLEKKSGGDAVSRFCPLEYYPSPEKQKVTTTPLLDFVTQRRAEKQKMRDDRREERRKKDQEYKRIKDAERDWQNMPYTADTDSTLKVLHNPDCEKEMKEDNVKEKEQKQSYGSRKQEEDRQCNNREKDIGQETRSHTTVKSYRAERLKEMEMRAQRKMSDEQHKTFSFDRSRVYSKTFNNHLDHDSEKSLSYKISETRRSQEFDKASGKHSETLRGQEFKHGHSSLKPTESQRHQDCDQHGRDSKYSGGNFKIGNERCKDCDYRKTYRESENRRSSYCKEMEQKNYANDQRRSVLNYSETENRRNIKEKKYGEQKVKKELHKEIHKEIIKTEKEVCGENKNWKNMGTKPKKLATKETAVEKLETVEDIKENKDPRGQNSKISPEKETKRNSQETAIKELEEPEKKEAEVKNNSHESHLSRTEYSKFERHIEHGAVLNMRRGSLDSGDHEADMQSNRMQRNKTVSDWCMEVKVKQVHSLEMESIHCERGKLESEKSVDDNIKAEHKDKNGDNCVEREQKRDSRAERRIRNKDRPSIEIYRPGMGKFSMQRKKCEKSTGTTESGMEQQSSSSKTSPKHEKQ